MSSLETLKAFVASWWVGSPCGISLAGYLSLYLAVSAENAEAISGHCHSWIFGQSFNLTSWPEHTWKHCQSRNFCWRGINNYLRQALETILMASWLREKLVATIEFQKF